MTARPSAQSPSRLARAKREALQLSQRLGDIPVGIASMTDRTLPVLMPTIDPVLFERTLVQSVAIDRPPPSQHYPSRATTLSAIASMGQSQFFPPIVTHPIVVLYTDGESSRLPPDFQYTLGTPQRIRPFLVHVSRPGEHVYAKGKIDQRYVEDPSSGASLQSFAALMKGRVFSESDVGGLAGAIHAAVGNATARTSVTQYARVALAPWFVLGAVVPLAFLLYRRNL